MTTICRRLVLLTLAAALLTSCTDDTDAPATPPAQASAPAVGKDPSGGPSDSGAGVEEFDPEAAIVSQTVAVPQSPEDQVEVSVLSLEVQGEVMKLRLAVTPRFTSVSDNDSINLFQALAETSYRPTLVDMDNLKQYAVLKDDDLLLLGSASVDTEARNGSPMLAYAYFAAPEDDIEVVDLRLTDFWPTFTDIPITR